MTSTYISSTLPGCLFAFGVAVVAVGCESESDDGIQSEIEQLFEIHETEATAAMDKFCTCASNIKSNLCTKSPDKCFQTEDKCLNAFVNFGL